MGQLFLARPVGIRYPAGSVSPAAPATAVCIYSFRPLVLAELERLISDSGSRPYAHHLESEQFSNLANLPVPAASAYVLEADVRGQATHAIVEEILARNAAARLLVVAERFGEEDSFPLLRLGVKGLLSSSEVSQHLARAVREVAAGGFWVPRAVLSRFVDATLAKVRRPGRDAATGQLSRREREVHELLLDNFSNKEIARRLHMSERTVKFHVSNLLAKHRVKRRADLILLSFAERKRA